MPKFEKGGKRPPNADRKVGSTNKTTGVLKEAILLAAQQIGDLNERGCDGLVGYLRFLARNYPQAYVSLLGRVRCYADRVTGSKEVRAEPFAAQVQAGNVHLIAGAWVQPFWDECELWPHGRFNDQVDAAAGAFNKLVSGLEYNLDYKQWAY